jgi:hypothetical protein
MADAPFQLNLHVAFLFLRNARTFYCVLIKRLYLYDPKRHKNLFYENTERCSNIFLYFLMTNAGHVIINHPTSGRNLSPIETGVSLSDEVSAGNRCLTLYLFFSSFPSSASERE